MRGCPIDGCEKQVPNTMLMCKTHWYMVPAHMRNAVWRAYKRGEGIFTVDYMRARDAAIAFVNNKLKSGGKDAPPRRRRSRLPGMAADDEGDVLPPTPAT